MKEKLLCYFKNMEDDWFTETGRHLSEEDIQGHIESDRFRDMFGALNIEDIADLFQYIVAGTYQTIPAIRYFYLYGDEQEYPENQNAVEFYISYNDECPYKGVKYQNGEIWIYGARKAYRVTKDDLELVMAER